MARVKPTTIISHWNHMIEGMQQSSNEFYAEIERLLGLHRLDDSKLERVKFSEAGLFSSKREYLQVRRKDHVFHVCAAPFGNGFFISWWLGDIQRGLWAWLGNLPLIGFLVQGFLKPLTYYKVDTALMFQSVTHGSVLAALDGLTNAKGMRALSDVERKPVMRDFFDRIK